MRHLVSSSWLAMLPWVFMLNTYREVPVDCNNQGMAINDWTGVLGHKLFTPNPGITNICPLLAIKISVGEANQCGEC